MYIALWTVLEGFMPISNILKEVDLILLREESNAETVYWCIAPSLIIESTFGIEMLKVFCIRLATPEVKVSDFEVTPDCRNRQKLYLTLYTVIVAHSDRDYRSFRRHPK